MTNQTLRARISGPSARLLAALATLGLATPALSAPLPQPELGGKARAVDATKAEDADKKLWSASVGLETQIGIGSFVSEPQDNSFVSTALIASGNYELADKLTIGASFALTWFQVLDFGTALEEHDVLMSDIGVALTHSSIYKHEDSGFNLSGSLSVGLPTSLASQFQNRLFSLKTLLRASIPAGPVTFSYTFAFSKYFNRTAGATVDCGDFDNPDECRSGRENNPDFGFESERRGAEVFLPGGGSSSYFIQNSLGIRWAIVEGLSANLGVTIFNLFGTRAFPEDELTNKNAQAGRSQTDRMVSTLGISYQALKELTVGLSLVTATTRPFGADGNDFVIFDFSRASDNITTINVNLTSSF